MKVEKNVKIKQKTTVGGSKRMSKRKWAKCVDYACLYSKRQRVNSSDFTVRYQKNNRERNF